MCCFSVFSYVSENCNYLRPKHRYAYVPVGNHKCDLVLNNRDQLTTSDVLSWFYPFNCLNRQIFRAMFLKDLSVPIYTSRLFLPAEAPVILALGPVFAHFERGYDVRLQTAHDVHGIFRTKEDILLVRVSAAMVDIGILTKRRKKLSLPAVKPCTVHWLRVRMGIMGRSPSFLTINMWPAT